MLDTLWWLREAIGVLIEGLHKTEGRDARADET
jgi:hypothetical protein